MLPSRQQLMTMPITLLEHQNVESPEEERIVQSVLNERRAKMPLNREIYRRDAIAAVIETPEQEKMWQKKIDERNEKARIKFQGGTEPTDLPDPEPEPTNEDTVPSVGEPTPATEPELPPQLEAKAKFCEFCDSKGVRHKLNCTRPR